jgi:AcrR family transcriptional regulator
MSTTRNERVRQASQQRREQQKQEIRQAILDAAAELFVAQGYQGFSLRQVAEQIGYSATTIYHHFANKDDLLFTVADAGFTRFGSELMAAAMRRHEPLERIEAIGRAYIEFGLRNPNYYQLMFIERADFMLGYRAGERKPRLGSLDIVRETIRAGIDQGRIRPGDPDIYANALWAAVHGVVTMFIAFPTRDATQINATIDATLSIVIRGLRHA